MKDVNQELFDQRRSVIESGGVIRRDDGTWVYADKSEVFGREGLDTTSGEVALYSAVPAWHALGNVVPGGVTDIDEVLKLAHIDFTVETRPVLWSPTDLGERQLDELSDEELLAYARTLKMHTPDRVTARDDVWGSLGVVGGRYRTLQNRASFEFLQDLCLAYDVPFESAGATRGGRATFVSMRLPGLLRVEGVDDEIIPFIVALNSHDGSTSFKVVATPWRPVCKNTEHFAVRDAYSSWTARHTNNATKRLEEARRSLRMSVEYFAQWKLDAEALARTDMEIDAFHDLVETLWKPPEPDAHQSAFTRAENRMEQLMALRSEARNYPGTAYGAERTITEFLDHPNRLEGKTAEQATRILDGADDERKSKAHKHLMALVA